MQLKCQRNDCQHEWNYKGEAPFYTSCPSCKGSVRVKRGDKDEN